jgi:P-type Ca2+ transporter type 2C
MATKAVSAGRSETSQTTTVVHCAVEGRIRLRVGAIHRDPALAATVARVAGAREGVRGASANARTGTLLVFFEPALSATAVREGVDELVRGILDGTVAPPRDEGPHHGSNRREHAERLATLVARIGANLEAGLHREEARSRLEREGANALPPARRRSELQILRRQFESLPVALLGGAAVLSVATGGIVDAVVILGVVVTNAAIGYATESQAERTLRGLVSRVPTHARVMRGGEALDVPLVEVVVGDLLVLAPAVFVAADARVVEGEALTADESTLTGESVPAEKEAVDSLHPELSLADRRNMVFRGTTIQGGHGLALVVATGAETEIGRIELLSRTIERPTTPLERQLERLGVELVVAAGAVCASVFAIGLLRGRPLLDIFRTSVSLAVAAVPEGLPTVAVTTLALGVRRMKRRRVAVRRLAAIETLGAIQVLCVDKTGTLTENRMTVVATHTETGDPRELEALHLVSALCNEAALRDDERSIGSPTEIALLRAARDAGVDLDEIASTLPILGARYRTPSRSFMETSHTLPSGARLLAVKGRPADVLRMARSRRVADQVRPLEEEDRERILLENERLAGQALRVLGVAYREDDGTGAPPEDAHDLVFLGLIGMTDPPREGLPELFARFRRAGIETVMITGDQSATAQAVARAIGLGNGRVETLDAMELERMDKKVLAELVPRIDVFTRVSPAHKLEIVRSLQAASRVVAMTGDGVNDSPALEAADVGIALGRTGSSAALESAAVILEGDDLEAIYDAIEQGRTIYEDIRKAVHFIVSTNASELLVTFATVAFGVGEALTPMDLLYLNLLTDVFPELALAVDPPEVDCMAMPPRDPSRPMFDRHDRLRAGVEAGVLTGTALGAFAIARRLHGPGPRAGTVAFSALTGAQLLHAVSARSERRSIFDSEHAAKNPYLGPTVALGIGLQVLATTLPGLRAILGTTRLGAVDAVVAASASLSSFVLNEGLKVVNRPRLDAGCERSESSAREGDGP